jgi:hypothetical protein
MLAVEAARERRPREEIIGAGLFPACAPLANPWMSVLDPGRAARELGFRPGAFAEWLPAVVERVAREPWPAGGESARARELALVG